MQQRRLPPDDDRNMNTYNMNTGFNGDRNMNTSTIDGTTPKMWYEAIKRHQPILRLIYPDPPLKLGKYQEFYYHLWEEFYDMFEGDDIMIHETIVSHVEEIYSKKLSRKNLCPFIQKIKNYLMFEKYPFLRNPDAPKAPKNSMEGLTFTKYRYGMITFTTPYKDVSEEDALEYLREIYKRWLEPKDKYPRDWRPFECNAWIECQAKPNNGRYIHMHVVYKRKDSHFNTGKGWLKNDFIKYTVNVQTYTTDARIINGINYAYNDAKSTLIEVFPKQIITIE